MGGGEYGHEMVLCGPDGPFGLVGPVVGGRDVLDLDGRGRLEEEVRQFLIRLVINNEMSEGLKTGGKETTGRFEGSDVRRGRMTGRPWVHSECNSCELQSRCTHG
jgi:hypothetical protein